MGDITTSDNVLSGPAAGMENNEQQDEPKEEPKWENADSSRFTKMRYDPETLTVSVQWKNGTIGNYLNVPAEAYEAWRASDSLGKHLQAHIIPHFQYQAQPSSS